MDALLVISVYDLGSTLIHQTFVVSSSQRVHGERSETSSFQVFQATRLPLVQLDCCIRTTSEELEAVVLT